MEIPLALKIFISYARSDAVVVDAIVNYLHQVTRIEEQNYYLLDIWLDRNDLPPAQEWKGLIEQGISQSHLVMLFVSPSSLNSGYVYQEFELAKQYRVPVLPLVYIPPNKSDIQATQATLFWEEIGSINYIDIQNLDLTNLSANLALLRIIDTLTAHWFQYLKTTCTPLKFSAIRGIIACLYATKHPWSIQFLKLQAFQLIQEKQVTEAQYYVHALAAMNNQLAQSACQELKNFWIAKLPEYLHPLLEDALKESVAPHLLKSCLFAEKTRRI